MLAGLAAEGPAIDPYDAVWLKSAIARLKPALRDTAVLVAGQQLTHSEAAEILGVERSNLYKKLRAFGITPRGGA